MIVRSISDKSVYLLKHFPTLVLLGARQVGKTTLSKYIQKNISKDAVYFDLENDKDLYRFQLDAQSLLEDNIDKLVIIDEVQRLPKLFALLRSMIDAKRKPSRYLLLGSASPELLKGVTESLAGRVSYLNLFPINFTEAKSKKISLKKHWFRGGYPDALLAKNDTLAIQWIDDYIKSYVERDLAQIYQLQLPASTIKNFWRMLAASNGGIWIAENYARALGVSGPTIIKYLSLLEGAFLIYKLQPWFVNVKKRVIKSSKIYVADSGILHGLNHIHSWGDLQRNVLIGSSWEGYVVQQIHQCLPPKIDLYFYRTQNGAEADLVFVKANKPIAIAEIKISETPTVSKGFFQCMEDLQTKKNYIITPSKNLFKDTKKGVNYVGLEVFLDTILQKI